MCHQVHIPVLADGMGRKRWDGMGRDGTGWDGMGRDGMRWDETGYGMRWGRAPAYAANCCSTVLSVPYCTVLYCTVLYSTECACFASRCSRRCTCRSGRAFDRWLMSCTLLLPRCRLGLNVSTPAASSAAATLLQRSRNASHLPSGTHARASVTACCLIACWMDLGAGWGELVMADRGGPGV